MTRQRLVLSIALAARRSQSHSDVAAFVSHAQSRWAVLSARHISWSATSDGTIPIKDKQQHGRDLLGQRSASTMASVFQSRGPSRAGQQAGGRPPPPLDESSAERASASQLQAGLRASSRSGSARRRIDVANLPLPRSGAALVAAMAGVSDVIKAKAPPGTATPYWLLFERYLAYMREHREANNGEIDVIIKPPDVAINAYFMALAADQVPYQKVYTALSVIELEFDWTLTNFAYQAVLKVCAKDMSEPAARMALRILDGLRERRTGITQYVLNLIATACKEGGLLDEAMSVLAEIHASFPGELSDHTEQTQTNVTWLAASQNQTEVVLFLLEQASRVGWTLPPGLIARCVTGAIDERVDPETVLSILNYYQAPEALEYRSNGPFLEEGLCILVLTYAAEMGHTGLALKAWECMETAILPTGPPTPGSAAEPGRTTEAASTSTQSGKEPAAIELIEDIHKPSIIAFHAMIHTFVRARQLKEAFRLVWQLQSVYPDRPEAVAYDRALVPLVDALAASAEDVDNSFYQLEEMHTEGEPLCPAMLDCVVAACSQIGDSTRAFETFAAYGNLGMVPGAQAYNAVLQGCIYHGLVDSVPKIVEDMKAAGVEFNALTHSLLVESFVVQNDHQAAADAHYEAQAAGNPIRPESFEKLISRCERNGAYDLMQRIYADRSYQGKDTGFDLAKMLRWRWREVGGLEKLTGGRNFVLRPIWAGFSSHEQSRLSRSEREFGHRDAPSRRSQRQAFQSRSPMHQEQSSRQHQPSAGNEMPLQQPPVTQKVEPLPLDW
ncbi:g10355 [Coccomyxa viridis]|uniref:G10355 protein n=1 Tax=Coccomyxa viridis TaxID=1274662 RepID=A0ABP1G7W2_9CHLO